MVGINQSGLSSMVNARIVERLSSVNVLVVDSDIRVASLVRRILESFGFRKICIVKSGKEGIAALKEQTIDMVISEWPMQPVQGVSFVSFIRSSQKENRTIPIILLTGRSELHDVQEARDAGVTEFVVKPFSAKTLSSRIIRIIEHPRNFIECKTYVGPDRRRRNDKIDGPDNRMQDLEKRRHATHVGKTTIYNIYDQEIRETRAEFSIKNKIGADVDIWEIFSEENVRQAQAVINDSAGDFMEWVVVDVARLDALYARLKSDITDEQSRNEMQAVALSIKSQSGSFDYHLATLIGKSMYNFMEEHPHLKRAHLVVLRKHIDILYVIFHKQMSGMGGNMGQELVDSLELLKQKHS